MPIFYFKCKKCNKEYKKLLSPNKAKETQPCPVCFQQLERDYKDPSTIIKEVIDNSIMTRRVEQYANSPELIEEREEIAKKSKKNNKL